MEFNWTILAFVAVVAIVLIVFVIIKNQKDKKEYSKFLDKEYKNTNEVDVDKDQY